MKHSSTNITKVKVLNFLRSTKSVYLTLYYGFPVKVPPTSYCYSQCLSPVAGLGATLTLSFKFTAAAAAVPLLRCYRGRHRRKFEVWSKHEQRKAASSADTVE